MGSCVKKCGDSSSKTTPSGSAKKSRCTSSKLKNKCCKGMPDAEGGGRNPFLRFLVHFKRCNKEKLCNLRQTQIVLSAGQKWKLMSCEEKSPYVQAARAAKYTFWTRSKDANRILRSLPQTAGRAEPQMQENFKLIGDLASWRQNVLDELLGVQNDGDKE